MPASSRPDRRFGPHYDRLFGYAVALTRDRDRARDLLHDCMVRALGARECPANERAFGAWLFTIMRNLWIDQVRARNREAALKEQTDDPASDAPMSLDSVVVNAFAVRQAFQSLSLAHREILALVDVGGFSYDEAATILAIPRGTVMSRVSRARQALAGLLTDERIAELPVNRRSRNQ